MAVEGPKMDVKTRKEISANAEKICARRTGEKVGKAKLSAEALDTLTQGCYFKTVHEGFECGNIEKKCMTDMENAAAAASGKLGDMVLAGKLKEARETVSGWLKEYALGTNKK
jgi:hypothetical protein